MKLEITIDEACAHFAALHNLPVENIVIVGVNESDLEFVRREVQSVAYHGKELKIAQVKALCDKQFNANELQRFDRYARVNGFNANYYGVVNQERMCLGLAAAKWLVEKFNY